MSHGTIVYWWVERGGAAPVVLDVFPMDRCYKFVVARGAQGRLYVLTADGGFTEHREIFRCASRYWQDLVPVGGGFGGKRFPGVSQAFGPVPNDIREAILLGMRTAQE